MSTTREPTEPRLLVPSLMFIALVVAAVGSLGAPLITSVATTFHVSLDSAQWTLTITLLGGAVATPVLGRLGAGPHRRGTILATLAVVVAGSALTVLPLRFVWLLVGRAAQGVGLGLTGEDVPDVEKIPSDEESVRRLIARLGNPRRLRACYEAGPTGYELARLLGSLGVACQVIAPALIPTAPGDRVKTDKRDCRRLARLHRAGQLVAVRVPTVAEEAVRDLCRARADMVIDRTRARHRLGKFLLRRATRGRTYE